MRDILARGLPQLGVSPDIIPRLEEFSRLLLEKNQVMNLTAITEPDQVATLHLLDSLSLLPLADFAGKTAVDVGTGAGFPGVPLAIAVPESRITLLDSLGKRVDFLRESCAALGLSNAVCVHARAEEFAGDRRESFDLAVSRAVAALPVLCELCLPLVKPGGAFIAMKSVDCGRELAEAETAIRLLGGRLRDTVDYTIPTTGIVHRAVIVEKVSPSPKKYPRRFAQIKKQPLGA